MLFHTDEAAGHPLRHSSAGCLQTATAPVPANRGVLLDSRQNARVSRTLIGMGAYAQGSDPQDFYRPSPLEWGERAVDGQRWGNCDGVARGGGSCVQVAAVTRMAARCRLLEA